MSEQNIDYSMLPEHMQDGMRRYVEQGISPGDFLYLILCNDFARALGQADSINAGRAFDYAKFLYLELPMMAWGSMEKVNKWMREKREEIKEGVVKEDK